MHTSLFNFRSRFLGGSKSAILSGCAIMVLSAGLLSGCSTMSGPQRPQFYPNDEYRNRGAASANQAADECMALADQYVEQPEAWKDALKTGATGAAIGAGTGAIGGVITKGSVGRTTAAGAAIGGIVGVLASLKDAGVQSPSYQRFVEHCLQKQGYEVVGWGN